MANIELKNMSWQTAGFDNIMEVSLTFVNKGKQSVKDIELTCRHASNSGTYIDSNKRVIYEIVPAGKSKRINDFSMGFIHNQATKTSCSITDLKIL